MYNKYQWICPNFGKILISRYNKFSSSHQLKIDGQKEAHSDSISQPKWVKIIFDIKLSEQRLISMVAKNIWQ